MGVSNTTHLRLLNTYWQRDCITHPLPSRSNSIHDLRLQVCDLFLSDGAAAVEEKYGIELSSEQQLKCQAKNFVSGIIRSGAQEDDRVLETFGAWLPGRELQRCGQPCDCPYTCCPIICLLNRCIRTT